MSVLNKVRKHIKRFERLDTIHKCMAKRFSENSEEFNAIMRSCKESKETHNGRKRLNGDSLITHERALVAIADYLDINVYEVYVALFLHDMHEDYPDEWPLSRIRRDYGAEVARLVDAVSKPILFFSRTLRQQNVLIFNKVRNGGHWAMVMKCIDRLHNMLTLWGGQTKAKRKVNQTIKYVLPISIDCNTLTYELMLATTEQSKRYRLSPSVHE